MKKSSFAKLTLAAVAVSVLMMSGCTKHPDETQLMALEEARGAAESAEQTLSAKKQERMQLEQQVSAKENELGQVEAERDDVQQKMNEQY